MNRVMIAALASFAFVTAGGAAAGTAAKGGKAKPKDPNGVTCKFATVVDSKIPQRICMTNFEWEDRHRAQMEAKRSSANRNSHCESAPC